MAKGAGVTLAPGSGEEILPEAGVAFKLGLAAAFASALASAKAIASCFFLALTAALALNTASLLDGLITLASPRWMRSAP